MHKYINDYLTENNLLKFKVAINLFNDNFRYQECMQQKKKSFFLISKN